MSEGGKSVMRVRTVSELTAEIKAALEGQFPLVDLEAEISGRRAGDGSDRLNRHPSGHFYFTLKDSESQISAVLFKWQLEACMAKGLVRLEDLRDGAKVKVRGSVSVYGPQGSYRFMVRMIRPVGEGELMRLYLELKSRLEAEGLFDPKRKRRLPFLPRRIGIVTSEAGAVIHDMCTVLTRRFPNLEIRLKPCLVQGATAPASIVAGIDYFQRVWRPDLLVVARGGGSFEDLFCFNDEAVVRAVAASSVPTISAVGHETDFTLCDFAADVRAGTPSIAAELAVPPMADLRQRLSVAMQQMSSALRARGEYYAQRTDQLSESLLSSLKLAQARAVERLTRLEPRLRPALSLCLQRETSRLERAEAKLKAYSPFGVLERGYSLTTTADGTVVKDADKVAPGAHLTTRLAHGAVESVVV